MFEFGAKMQSMCLMNHATTPDLRFNLYPQYAQPIAPNLRPQVRVNGLLQTNQWIHIAAVSGPGGMKLYANGELVGQGTNKASFADIKVSQTNWLGRGLTANAQDQDFRGQLHELRVWEVQRTPEEIRDNIARRLTGNEAGLVALWRFESAAAGIVKDAGAHGYEGRLMGNARVIAGGLPAGELPGTRAVLDLAGTNSYAEFPAHAFTNLSAATVEGWMKWQRFDSYTRFFDFGGTEQYLTVNHRQQTPDLEFELWAQDRPRTNTARMLVPGVLQSNQWYHIAAVSGPGGMKLYVNGALMATNGYSGSFARITQTGHNYLGKKNRSSSTSDTCTDGQMAEVRIWNVERTAEQIRQQMSQQLTGREDGLVSLWNFENVTSGVIKDAGPVHEDGKLMGDARIVRESLPRAVAGPVAPPTLAGTPASRRPATNIQPATASNPASADKVLHLDGTSGTHVELPPNLLNGLDTVTIEGWVRWQEFNPYSRFFSFGQGDDPTTTRLAVMNVGDSNTLSLVVDDFVGDAWRGWAIYAPEPLPFNQWVHIAAVVSQSSMSLYANGVLQGVETNAGLARLKGDRVNRLGVVGFEGDMDDVRLWSITRTAEEIRADQFTKLSGKEPGLLASWNFDDSTARDAMTNHYDGKLMGNARIVPGSPGRQTPTLAAHSQAATTASQQVLQVNGGSLDLPKNLVTDLDGFTFEGWAKWNRFNNWSRFFTLGESAGSNRKHISVQNVETNSLLDLDFFERRDGTWAGRALRSTNGFGAGDWIHVAVAATRSNMWLYVNGNRIGEIPDRGFASLNGDTTIQIGTLDFDGQVAELRLWNRVRTEAEIKGNIFQKLSGQETNLIGLWNFSDPANPGRDVSSADHDGKLVGQAKTVTTSSPPPADSVSWSVASGRAVRPTIELFGTITSSSGTPASRAAVSLSQDGVEIRRTVGDTNGAYSLTLLEPISGVDLAARFENEAIFRSGLSLGLGERRRLDLKTLSYVSISGRIMDIEGRPLSAAMVQLLPGASAQTNVLAVALSHADGSYHFRHVPSGQYRARAQGPDGFLEFEPGRTITVKEAGTTGGIDFRLPFSPSQPPSATNSQPENLAFNRNADATSGSITLPGHIFDELDEATVEGWVRCGNFNNNYFYSYGGEGNRMLLKNLSANPTLRAEMSGGVALPHPFKSN
ncbi:MAG TPA: LamG-like jellyroll fold domain-containing protein, partial [Candidatus Dormibacteraeota bacterium]|nr:LamG-like jellyroll fold domain-containing protein [Candidatus Dormibacteraeota bacterium]